MKTFQLMDNVQFNEVSGHAEPIHVDKMGRALLFALRPGQAIKEHNVPFSPVYFVVLKGVSCARVAMGKSIPSSRIRWW